MKNMYLSPLDFKRNCPCADYLEGYLQTLIPTGTTYELKSGKKLDDKKYAATYDIFSSAGNHSLEVTCDMSIKWNYRYSFRKMND